MTPVHSQIIQELTTINNVWQQQILCIIKPKPTISHSGGNTAQGPLTIYINTHFWQYASCTHIELWHQNIRIVYINLIASQSYNYHPSIYFKPGPNNQLVMLQTADYWINAQWMQMWKTSTVYTPLMLCPGYKVAIINTNTIAVSFFTHWPLSQHWQFRNEYTSSITLQWPIESMNW